VSGAGARAGAGAGTWGACQLCMPVFGPVVVGKSMQAASDKAPAKAPLLITGIADTATCMHR
jgi:hypothetical protein